MMGQKLRVEVKHLSDTHVLQYTLIQQDSQQTIEQLLHPVKVKCKSHFPIHLIQEVVSDFWSPL